MLRGAMVRNVDIADNSAMQSAFRRFVRITALEHLFLANSDTVTGPAATPLQKFCRISAALRQDLNDDSDLFGFLVVRNEHHKRDASLFSIEHQFPKLDVAGSIPVSRSIY